MAGIYIHVPYCKTICHYCDFYKTANIISLPEFIEALLKEINFKKGFLTDEISTIYFGGGTPSVLNFYQFSLIIDSIRSNFKIADSPELTVELNPDDCTTDYLLHLYSLGINRLSIGNQSFNDNILKYLNRRHNASSSVDAVKRSIDAGFSNISCDLIYGIPNQTLADFEKDLHIINEFGITHLSAYHLTIEPSTYFGKLQKSGKLYEIDEDLSESFYNLLVNWSYKHSFEHYEVSNFAKDGFYSGHNMNYWFGIPYLGLGPSAHSFDGSNRFFNVSNIKKYLFSSFNSNFDFEKETLTDKDCYNEFVLLRLRTKWGIDFSEIKKRFDTSFCSYFMRIVDKYKNSDFIRMESGRLMLSEKGLFASDFIIREFFVV